MLWISVCHSQEIVTINENTSLLQDSVWTHRSRGLDVPHKLVLVAVCESCLDLLFLILSQVVLEAFIESTSNYVIATANETISVQIIGEVRKHLFPSHFF